MQSVVFAWNVDPPPATSFVGERVDPACAERGERVLGRSAARNGAEGDLADRDGHDLLGGVCGVAQDQGWQSAHVLERAARDLCESAPAWAVMTVLIMPALLFMQAFAALPRPASAARSRAFWTWPRTCSRGSSGHPGCTSRDVVNALYGGR